MKSIRIRLIGLMVILALGTFDVFAMPEDGDSDPKGDSSCEAAVGQSIAIEKTTAPVSAGDFHTMIKVDDARSAVGDMQVKVGSLQGLLTFVGRGGLEMESWYRRLFARELANAGAYPEIIKIVKRERTHLLKAFEASVQSQIDVTKGISNADRLQLVSEQKLADLYVALERNRIFERILGGDLKGFAGDVDQKALADFTDFLRNNYFLLGHAQVFGKYYEEDGSGKARQLKDLDSDSKTRLEKFTIVRTMVQDWMSLWPMRIEMLEPKIKFNFAWMNLASLGYSLWMTNKPIAQAKNLGKVGRDLAAAVARIRGLRLIPALFMAPAEKPVASSDDIKAVVAAFNGLTEKIRATPEGGLGNDNVTWNAMRDEMSVIHGYLLQRSNASEKLDKEVFALLASARAIDLINWMRSNVEQHSTGVLLYDTLIEEWIIQIQFHISLDRYNKLNAQLFQNLIVSATGLYGIYEGIDYATSGYLSNLMSWNDGAVANFLNWNAGAVSNLLNWASSATQMFQ